VQSLFFILKFSFFVFRVLGKSLCDGPPVRRDLPHDINWRVRASKGFHIVGYCLAVLSSPEHNSSKQAINCADIIYIRLLILMYLSRL
jgi:hypothetical protein